MIIFLKDCAPGTAFCNVLKMCTWSYNVNCDTRSFNGMSGMAFNQNSNTYGFNGFSHTNWNSIPQTQTGTNNEGYIPENTQINNERYNTESQHETININEANNSNRNVESRLEDRSPPTVQQNQINNNAVQTPFLSEVNDNEVADSSPKPVIIIQTPSQDLLPPLEDSTTDISNIRTGRDYELQESTTARITLRMNDFGSDSIHSNDIHAQEATIKPAQERPNHEQLTQQLPGLLLSSRVASDFQKYYANPAPKIKPATPKPAKNDRNSDSYVEMQNDEPQNSENRIGDDYDDETTRTYMKFSKDQEPVLLIYDHPITLTVTQRPYQMPQSYNHEYYQSFIKPVHERDQTAGIAISDSMKKLLLPYMVAKHNKHEHEHEVASENTSSTDPNLEVELISSTEKQDLVQTTTKAIIDPTDSSFDVVFVTTTESHSTRFDPGSNVQPSNPTPIPAVNRTPLTPENSTPRSTLNSTPSRSPNFTPRITPDERRPPNYNPDRIVFPGPQSNSRVALGYFHTDATRAGHTPQITEMRPIHHRGN